MLRLANTHDFSHPEVSNTAERHAMAGVLTEPRRAAVAALTRHTVDR